MIYYDVKCEVASASESGRRTTITPDVCETREEAQEYVDRLQRQHGTRKAWVEERCTDCEAAKMRRIFGGELFKCDLHSEV